MSRCPENNTVRVSIYAKAFFLPFCFSIRDIEKGIIRWDVSNVKNMDNMFHSATNFNGSLDNWDISNVESMNFMLSQADSFNKKSLSTWTRPKIIPRNVSFGTFFSNTPLIYRFRNSPGMRAEYQPRWLTEMENDKENERIEKQRELGSKFLQELTID